METNRISKFLQITNNIDKWAGNALNGLLGEGGRSGMALVPTLLLLRGSKI